jgi:hypothetical protein
MSNRLLLIELDKSSLSICGPGVHDRFQGNRRLHEGCRARQPPDQQLQPLTFSTSWPSLPDAVAVERAGPLPANFAHSGVKGSVFVDAPPLARH